jgi:hypothetical protein
MTFRDVSITATKFLTKECKQKGGIFFTPKEDRSRVFEILDSFKVCPSSILEPSFGSGEFLEDIYERYPRASVTGVELNTHLFQLSSKPNLYNIDFMEYTGKHDLIIGNPPYFVIPKSKDTVLCQTNRPNMFVQFLYKSITENLTEAGYLAFVLPTSLFNCSYYELVRRYMFEFTTILAVERLDGSYLETQQPTFMLVLQKGKRNDNFFIERNGSVYITPFKDEIADLILNTKTLSELGFKVSTGEVVWNQEKDKLSDQGVLLIYSSNFKDGVLDLESPLKNPKKQYIQGFKRAPLSGKVILINRGYGNASYSLKCVLFESNQFYAENHVNVVRPVTKNAEQIIDSVYRSLLSDNTSRFIEYFVGNNALSKSEIESCLPIWLD